MELQIVEFFKSLSCKFCDVLFSFTNILGEDLFFYLVFFALYWAYKKEFAFKYALVYFSSCLLNIGFKSVVRRVRPIGATASGYSFPSGHAQSFSTVATGLLYESNKKNFLTKRWQRIEFFLECLIGALLVGIGRMYWGQHYLTDVVAGIIIGFVFTIFITYIIDIVLSKIKVSLKKVFLVIAPILVVGYIVIATTNLIKDIDALAKVYRAIGISLSVIVAYFIDKKWLQYSTEDTMKNRLSKIIAGSAVLMMIYSLFLRDLAVDVLYPVYYFMLGIVALVILPWIFKTIKNPATEAKD